MTTTRALYTALPDSKYGTIWGFRRSRMPKGFAAFGQVVGVYIWIYGHDAGLVAMDWLRDRGIEPVAA